MQQKIDKTILAIDTAMGGVSVGVIASNGHIVSRQVEMQREQASMLIPIIQEVLKEAQIGFKDIDLLVSTIGPGSFTGLRIGLTTAKVLSASLSIPLIGLNTLQVMAHHYETAKPVLIVLETKRKDVYFQYFDTDRTDLTPPSSGLCEAVHAQAPIDDFDVGGDCLNRYQSEVSVDLSLLDNWVQPDPILMAQLGWHHFQEHGAPESVSPVYLRDADVSVSKKPQRHLSQS